VFFSEFILYLAKEKSRENKFAVLSSFCYNNLMKMFVTGGTGFIGRRLVEKLAQDQNNQIICLTRNISKVPLPAFNNVEYVEGDITKPETYEKFMEGIDVVYHLAADLSYGNIDTQKMRDTNVLGTSNLFGLADKNDVKKVIYVSTAAIFHPTKDVIANENTPIILEEKNTNYTRTKTDAHFVAKDYINKGLPLTIALPSSVYGKGSPLFLPIIESIEQGKIQFVPFSESRLSLIHADDLCDGIILLQEKGKSGESYIFSGENLTFIEIIKLIAKIRNKTIRIIKIPDFILKSMFSIKTYADRFLGLKDRFNTEMYNFISGNLVASDEKARKALGWKNKLSIEKGFKEMLSS